MLLLRRTLQGSIFLLSMCDSLPWASPKGSVHRSSFNWTLCGSLSWAQARRKQRFRRSLRPPLVTKERIALFYGGNSIQQEFWVTKFRISVGIPHRNAPKQKMLH